MSQLSSPRLSFSNLSPASHHPSPLLTHASTRSTSNGVSKSASLNRIYLLSTPKAAKTHSKTLQVHLKNHLNNIPSASHIALSTIHLYEWNTAIQWEVANLLGTEALSHERYVVFNTWKGTMDEFMRDSRSIVQDHFVNEGPEENSLPRERSGSGGSLRSLTPVNRTSRSSSVNSIGSTNSNRSSGGFSNNAVELYTSTDTLYSMYKSQADMFLVVPDKIIFPRAIISEKVTVRITVTNRLDTACAFKIKTTSPRGYCVSPKGMILQAHQTQVVDISKMAGIDEKNVAETRFRIEGALLGSMQRVALGWDFSNVFAQQEVLSRQKLHCEVVSTLPDDYRMEKRETGYHIEMVGSSDLQLPALGGEAANGVPARTSSPLASTPTNGNSPTSITDIHHLQSTILQLQRDNHELKSLNSRLRSDLASANTLLATHHVGDVPQFVNMHTLLGRNLSMLSVSELSQLHHTLQDATQKVFSEYAEKSRSDNDQCLLCLDDQRSVLFLPCKHIVACNQCTKAMQEKHMQENGNLCGGIKCPLCRQKVSDMIFGVHL